MTLDAYQERARATARYPARDFAYATLGLAGEAGEVANKVKKVIRDDAGVLNSRNTSAIADELGDVLWYAAALATEIGLPLSVIAELNYRKLTARDAANKIQGSGDGREKEYSEE